MHRKKTDYLLRLRHVITGLLLWLGLTLAHAAAPDVVLDMSSQQDISTGLEMYRDAGGQLGVNEVVEISTDFMRPTRADLLRGFDSGVYWLRTTLHNPSPGQAVRWLAVGNPRLQSATLFQADGGGWQGQVSGTSVPLSQKPIPATQAVFPVTLQAGASTRILLRISSQTAIDMGVTLWEPAAYRDAEGQRHLSMTLGIGGALVSFTLALFVFLLLREFPYLYFGLLQLCSAALELAREGLLQRYLWPTELPLWPQTISVSGIGLSISLLMFLRSFLGLAQRLPHWSRAITGLVWLLLAILLGTFINYGKTSPVLSVVALVGMLLCPLLSLLVWRQGYRPARFLLMGFSLFWVLEALRQLTNLGILNLPQAMNFSLSWTLLATTPLLLLALTERTREVHARLVLTQQMSREKSDFLARVSHELRAPLSIIIGYARLLGRESPRLSLQEGTADIARNGLRLQLLIDELLEQSQLEAKRLRLAPTPFALEPWLDEVARAGQQLADGPGNRFVLQRDTPLPAFVLADAHRLRQVLDNLLTNANRHTQRGEVSLHCAAKGWAGVGDGNNASGQPLKLLFTVKDTGAGIAYDEQARIFEPFVQGNNQQCVGVGFGLGLSIARDLVRLMGGELSVRSQPGSGCTFSFWVECTSACASTALPELSQADEPASARVPEPMPMPMATAAALLPDATQLAALHALVAGGEISAIEEWCAALSSAQPELTDYAQQVQAAARQLDFASLKRFSAGG